MFAFAAERYAIWGGALVLLALLRPVPARADAAAPEAEGEALFRTHCAACHAPQPLAAKVNRIVPLGWTDEQLRRFLIGHHTSGDEQRRPLIAYLRSLKE
jgi:mono/diheme cytochrome c family protein